MANAANGPDPASAAMLKHEERMVRYAKEARAVASFWDRTYSPRLGKVNYRPGILLSESTMPPLPMRKRVENWLRRFRRQFLRVLRNG